jgi:hypothetical protein
MDRALEQADVLNLIIDFADSNSTLLALSRTNSVISAFALDRLWNKLESLYPLAKVMKESLWDEYECEKEDPAGPGPSRIIVCI